MPKYTKIAQINEPEAIKAIASMNTVAILNSSYISNTLAYKL